MKDYEVVIGLEVHVELATKTKIFCGCSTAFGGAPNTHTCPVCTGMPGSLPVLNKKVVEYAMAVGLATNCSITRDCKFDRKNYFYPDNPQNYQISQLYLPICRDGHVDVKLEDGTEKSIRIHEIHMEEDAGKLIHDEWEDVSYVDYNRSGVPLIEIVSEPDMRNAEEVIAYLTKLRNTIQYLGASDCKLQEGSMRADVNLSVREKGSTEFGTRTETKNLNSFSAIQRAIEAETARQIDIIEAGGQVVQETRRWNDDKEYSYAMRSKEDAQDYRYFPDPDLVPIHISEEWLDTIKEAQPEFKDEKMLRYKEEFGIPDYDINMITDSKKLADIFEETTALCNKPKKVSNWLITETMRILKEKNMDPEDITFSPKSLARIIELADEGSINSNVAKEIFEKIFDEDIDPDKYIEENGLKQVNDEGALKATVEKVIADNPQSVADYRAGKEKAIGFLVGQTMNLIEKAEQHVDEEKAKKLEEKLRKNRFTLTDYYEQLVQLRGMGDLSQLAEMMPGGMGKQLAGAEIDPKVMAHTEAIILSMTPEERENPKLLGASRKKRVAAGCGLEVVDVNRLLKQFEMMQDLVKQMTRGRMPKGLGGFGGKGGMSRMHGFGRKKRFK